MKPLAAWFFQPAPATRLAAIRWLVLGFAVVYLMTAGMLLLRPMFLPASAFHPVGVINILNAPLPAALVVAVYVVSLVSGLAALTGAFYRLSSPLFALSLLWMTSYRSSWGMLFHTENLLVLHVAALACCPQAADVWAWRRSQESATTAERYGWPLKVLSLVTVAAYMVSGIAKLIHAGPGWLGGAEIRAHIAFDAIRKLELGSVHSPIGAALVKVPWVFTPLAWLTLTFELGAPLALFGGRLTRVWVLTCWSFHAGVLLLMMIVFPYPLSAVAFASLFRAERLVTNAAGYLTARLDPASRLSTILRRHVDG